MKERKDLEEKMDRLKEEGDEVGFRKVQATLQLHSNWTKKQMNKEEEQDEAFQRAKSSLTENWWRKSLGKLIPKAGDEEKSEANVGQEEEKEMAGDAEMFKANVGEEEKKMAGETE